MSKAIDAELSTRDKLIEAAISIIEKDGEVGIRVDRVAELAGFTKPVLYHYFTDREAIIAAAQAERFRRSLEIGWENLAELLRRAASAHDFLELMRKWINGVSGSEGEARRRFRVEVLGSAVSRPALMASVVEASRIHADRVAVSLELAQAKGWIKPSVSARDLAHWWVGTISTRFLFEIDQESYALESWDEITDLALVSMFTAQ